MQKCCIPYIPCRSLLLSTIVLNDDDAVDVVTIFAYLREWLHHSGEDGPTDSDVQSFSEYICAKLA